MNARDNKAQGLVLVPNSAYQDAIQKGKTAGLIVSNLSYTGSINDPALNLKNPDQESSDLTSKIIPNEVKASTVAQYNTMSFTGSLVSKQSKTQNNNGLPIAPKGICLKDMKGSTFPYLIKCKENSKSSESRFKLNKSTSVKTKHLSTTIKSKR